MHCALCIDLPHFPLKAVFGVFHVEASFVQAVADEVARGPVLGGLGTLAHLEQQVHGLAVRLEVHVVATGSVIAHSQHVEEIGLERGLEGIDVGL